MTTTICREFLRRKGLAFVLFLMLAISAGSVISFSIHQAQAQSALSCAPYTEVDYDEDSDSGDWGAAEIKIRACDDGSHITYHDLFEPDFTDGFFVVELEYDEGGLQFWRNWHNAVCDPEPPYHCWEIFIAVNGDGTTVSASISVDDPFENHWLCAENDSIEILTETSSDYDSDSGTWGFADATIAYCYDGNDYNYYSDENLDPDTGAGWTEGFDFNGTSPDTDPDGNDYRRNWYHSVCQNHFTCWEAWRNVTGNGDVVVADVWSVPF